MEITSKVLGIKEWPNNLSIKIMLNGSEQYAKCSKKPENEELLAMLRGLSVGNVATFDMSPWTNPNTQKESLYINGVVPEHDVNSDSPEKQIQEMVDEQPTGKSRKVEFNTKQVQVSSYDKCNAMNASVALMVVIFDKHPEMPEEDLFEMHKGFIDRVKIGAENILDDYHGK